MAKKFRAAPDFALLDENDDPVDPRTINESMVTVLSKPQGGEVKESKSPVVIPTASGEEGLPRYFVRLRCPTPILYPDGVELRASSDDEARKRFCDLNGLSGSDHTWDIRQID